MHTSLSDWVQPEQVAVCKLICSGLHAPRRPSRKTHRGWLLQEKVINDVLLADQPSKKFVRPEEIGALVRHLCSDDAQSFQGACISIDGGWTAR